MTDQITHEQWTRPTRTLERAGPDPTEAQSSTQDGTAPDRPAAERSAEDGAVYPSAEHDAAVPATDVSSSGELLPGDVPTEPVALFDSAATQEFRDRWQQLQLRFIDDPHTVAAQAGTLADEVVTALRDAVDQHRTGLEDWQSDDGVDAHFGDTERLRVAVRGYRDFVDRLLAM